jgi:hypothetical protein
MIHHGTANLGVRKVYRSMKFKDHNLLNDIDLHIMDILGKDSSTPLVGNARAGGSKRYNFIPYRKSRC